MPRTFTNLRLRFAWLKGEIDSARSPKQVRDALSKGRKLVDDALGSYKKKTARSSLRKLNEYAKRRLALLSAQ
jgi:predicted aldo/keto reductase-like oxidoreductase